jgi:hypothetical protein
MENHDTPQNLEELEDRFDDAAERQDKVSLLQDDYMPVRLRLNILSLIALRVSSVSSH